MSFILVEEFRRHVGALLHRFLGIYLVDFSLSDESCHAKINYLHIVVVANEDVIRFQVHNLDVGFSQGLDLVTELQLEGS